MANHRTPGITQAHYKPVHTYSNQNSPNTTSIPLVGVQGPRLNLHQTNYDQIARAT